MNMTHGGENHLSLSTNPTTTPIHSSSPPNSPSAPANAGPDHFAYAVAKAAVAQILQATGFHASCHSAIDALSDLTIRYILALSKTTTSSANIAGRNIVNLFDLVQGLEDLGFSGAGSDNCFLESGVLMELNRFVQAQFPPPFAQFIRICQATRRIVTISQIGEDLIGKKHIPGCLPAYPPLHTYMHTDVWLDLQKRILGSAISGLVPIGSGTNSGTFDKGKQIIGENPFLMPPLPHGSKEVLEIVPPS